MKTNGPKLKIDASCFDCEHCHSESYACQGDSGFDVSCVHPEKQGNGRIGDTSWKTPEWCPLYSEALTKLIADKQSEAATKRTP